MSSKFIPPVVPDTGRAVGGLLERLSPAGVVTEVRRMAAHREAVVDSQRELYALAASLVMGGAR